MQIRNATVNDLDEITSVEFECFPVSEAATKQDFKERLSVYSNHFWLLQDGEKLIGFINGMVTNDADLSDEMYKNADMHSENGKWQMIFGVNTIPSYRRRGCAKMLMKQVIVDTKKQGREGIVLTCKEQLIPYYAKFGFENEGLSQSVHGNTVWHQMRLRL